MNHDNRGRLTVNTDGNWRLYSNTIPPGAEAVGTVTQGVGYTGALIRYAATGIYAQLNAGAVKPLSQHKVKAVLEPAGRGRPDTMDAGRRTQVYLDAPSLATAERLGAGNVSAGIRAALDGAEQLDALREAARLALCAIDSRISAEDGPARDEDRDAYEALCKVCS